ncbi:MAG: hypothetical protein ACT4O5_14930 [Gammaproteobacteria bacterium]
MNARTIGLLTITGLVVAYVRNYLQYHRYSFESIGEFIGFWLVHYLAIGLLGALFYAWLGPLQQLVLGRELGGKEPTLDSAIVSWCWALLLCAIALFVLAHWPAGYAESLDE